MNNEDFMFEMELEAPADILSFSSMGSTSSLAISDSDDCLAIREDDTPVGSYVDDLTYFEEYHASRKKETSVTPPIPITKPKGPIMDFVPQKPVANMRSDTDILRDLNAESYKVINLLFFSTSSLSIERSKTFVHAWRERKFYTRVFSESCHISVNSL